MSSGRSQPLILFRHDAIQHWRNIMGPTKVFSTRFSHPDCIRGQFGLTDTRNSSHGSDSDETAAKEIKFFFPEFDYEQFFSSGQDELFLQSQVNGNLLLDRTSFQHFL